MPCPLPAAHMKLYTDMNKNEFHFSILDDWWPLNQSSSNDGTNGMPSSLKPNVAKHMMAV